MAWNKSKPDRSAQKIHDFAKAWGQLQVAEMALSVLQEDPDPISRLASPEELDQINSTRDLLWTLAEKARDRAQARIYLNSSVQIQVGELVEFLNFRFAPGPWRADDEELFDAFDGVVAFLHDGPVVPLKPLDTMIPLTDLDIGIEWASPREEWSHYTNLYQLFAAWKAGALKIR